MTVEVKQPELQSIVDELRTTIESKNAESAESKEKLDKIEADLVKHEEKNQELVKKLEQEEKAREELKEGYKNLEQKLYLMPNGIGKEEKTAHMKAFEKFCIEGKSSLGAEEVKYLRTDNNIEGGYLAPIEYVTEINKNITEISPVRSVARVRTTSSKAMEIPKRTGLATAYWRGEAQTVAQSNSQYGQTTIKVERLTGMTEITLEELNQAAFNMESEINSDMVESFNKVEGTAFVNGIGAAANQPEGFMQAAGVTSINSGLAADIEFDNLLDLIGELKTGYNPIYGMNRKTIVRVMKLKNGTGDYLWQAGNVAAGVPNTIQGYRYVEMPDMDDIGAGNYPIVFGDFRYYTVVDHTMMLAIRDDYTLAADGKVRFLFHRFVGGAMEIQEAFAKLKCSV